MSRLSPTSPTSLTFAHRLRRGVATAGLGLTSLALVAAGIAVPAAALAASAAPLAAAKAMPAGPVSETPASSTPALGKTKTTQRLRQIVQCGSMMYAVGYVWNVTQNGTSYRRAGLLSFSATPPYTLSALDPEVNGQVNSIAFSPGTGCADAYIGGTFTNVHGTAVTNIAEISTSTGTVVSTFGHDANGAVDTLVAKGSHLLTGGEFTQINGSSRNYYASLSPVTGRDDGFVNLNISGSVPGSDRAQVFNQQLSHGGTLLLTEGNFTSIGGQKRQQIAMINLATTHASVTKWRSAEFGQDCTKTENFYIRSAAWSPNDATVYVADTGDHPLNWNHGFPLTGLCDAVAAFPSVQSVVAHRWINYSGCDSYYTVAADDGAVYAAGHPRWAHNPDGCNNAGPGAVSDRGLQGLYPSTGGPELRSGHARWTMSRANANSMLVTSSGLWIASSNRFGADACNGAGGHAGICLLPYA
jgi:hypothetical protein